MRYLDPRADLTFKKVFGEHPDLVMSLLNALLPFDTEEQMIQEVEYLPIEQVPDTPLKKNSIVDVKCRDGQGRIFIVEMQMMWSEMFRQRVLFNASKAYVRQLDRKEDFNLLQPVYSLNLVNEIFEPELKDEFIHYYNMVHTLHNDRIIEGLHLTFVELPKFKPHNYSEKKMQVLWLRFLTEINEHTRQVPAELLENAQINKALALVEESAYSDAQMEGYDQFWDAVRVEKTLVNDVKRAREKGEAEGMKQGMKQGMAKGMEQGMAKGMEQGMAKGMAKGMEQGMAKGMEQGMAKGMEQGMAKGMEQGMAKGMEQGRAEGAKEQAIDSAKKMKEGGLGIEQIAKFTGLSIEEVRDL